MKQSKIREYRFITSTLFYLSDIMYICFKLIHKIMNIFKDWGKYEAEPLIITLGNVSDDITTGTKEALTVPYDMWVTKVYAIAYTAPVGASIIVDLHLGGSTVLKNKITIETTKRTSEDSATYPTLVNEFWKKGLWLEGIIDQIGDSTAGTGIKVYIEHYKK